MLVQYVQLAINIGVGVLGALLYWRFFLSMSIAQMQWHDWGTGIVGLILFAASLYVITDTPSPRRRPADFRKNLT